MSPHARKNMCVRPKSHLCTFFEKHVRLFWNAHHARLFHQLPKKDAQVFWVGAFSNVVQMHIRGHFPLSQGPMQLTTRKMHVPKRRTHVLGCGDSRKMSKVRVLENKFARASKDARTRFLLELAGTWFSCWVNTKYGYGV
jgi:hypothetical protein